MLAEAVFDRTPPCSSEAERVVLCSMLIERDAIVSAMEFLEDLSFYWEKHRRIYRGMVTLWERGAAIDLVALAEQLKSTGELESAGGYDYLADLLDATPTAANVEHHARTVRDKARLRGLIEVASETIRDAYHQEGRSTDEIVSSAETRLLEIGQRGSRGYVWVKERLWGVFEGIERRQELEEGKTPGLSTGLKDLDGMTLGLHPGAVTIVAGRPSMGKTALAWKFAIEATVAQQIPTLVFSFEMSADECIERAMAAEGRVDLQAIRGGRKITQEEHQRIAAASGHLNTAPLFIVDDDEVHIHAVAAKARRAHKAEGIGLVVIDYVQLLDGDGESRRERVEHVSRNCKRLARSLRIPVVVVSQLSRGPENRADKRPQLSDLRETGGLEQDADDVILVYRPDYYMKPEDRSDEGGVAELIIPKQRNGPTGTVRTYFRKRFTLFENYQRADGGTVTRP